jgi:hypothetical protein
MRSGLLFVIFIDSVLKLSLWDVSKLNWFDRMHCMPRGFLLCNNGAICGVVSVQLGRIQLPRQVYARAVQQGTLRQLSVIQSVRHAQLEITKIFQPRLLVKDAFWERTRLRRLQVYV